jgi:hypothetical protein
MERSINASAQGLNRLSGSIGSPSALTRLVTSASVDGESTLSSDCPLAIMPRVSSVICDSGAIISPRSSSSTSRSDAANAVSRAALRG